MKQKAFESMSIGPNMPFAFRSAAFLLLTFAAALDAFVATFNIVRLGSSAMMRWDEKVDPRSRMALSYR